EGLNLLQEVSAFRSSFEADNEVDFKFISNGLFGYFSYDTIEYLEDIQLTQHAAGEKEIPLMQYHIYRYVIAIDHFKNELYIFEHQTEKQDSSAGVEKIPYLIQNKKFPEYRFYSEGEETSNHTDDEFIAVVENMKKQLYL